MPAPEQTYVALAAASAMREYITTFKDDCTFGERQTVNKVDDALRRLETHFKRVGLHEHPQYDKMVEVFMETYLEVEERILIKE